MWKKNRVNYWCDFSNHRSTVRAPSSRLGICRFFLSVSAKDSSLNLTDFYQKDSQTKEAEIHSEQNSRISFEKYPLIWSSTWKIHIFRKKLTLKDLVVFGNFWQFLPFTSLATWSVIFGNVADIFTISVDHNYC